MRIFTLLVAAIVAMTAQLTTPFAGDAQAAKREVRKTVKRKTVKRKATRKATRREATRRKVTSRRTTARRAAKRKDAKRKDKASRANRTRVSARRTRPAAVSRRRPMNGKYKRRRVLLSTPHKPGTIIVDTQKKFLFLVTGRRSAIRYGIGVGREGFGWGGTVKVAAKREWPDWTPPPEMVEREWRQNKRRVSFQKGGPGNPLGARALYLHKGRGDTGYRIHGTNEPWSIGQAMSSGCVRMLNKDVEHLYARTRVGSKVVVIGPGGPTRRQTYRSGLGSLF